MDGLPIDSDQIKVGDRVIIVKHKTNSYDRGEVKFIGKLGKDNDNWYGIDLDEPKGKHDGKGKFKARENHGTFVLLKHLKLLVSEDFSMVKLKKQLKLEIDNAKKEQLETVKTSELPKIVEENDEENTERS